LIVNKTGFIAGKT